MEKLIKIKKCTSPHNFIENCKNPPKKAHKLQINGKHTTKDSFIDTIGITEQYKQYLVDKGVLTQEETKLGRTRINVRVEKANKRIEVQNTKREVPKPFILTKSQYHEVMKTMFETAQDYIIEGKVLHIGKGLGMIGGMTIKTGKKVDKDGNVYATRIDYNATKKLTKLLLEKEAEGVDISNKKYFVPTSFSHVCYIKWFKRFARGFDNSLKYRCKFLPTESNTSNSGKVGFKRKFSHANLANPDLKWKYVTPIDELYNKRSIKEKMQEMYDNAVMDSPSLI
jgi:hypothetical protein